MVEEQRKEIKVKLAISPEVLRGGYANFMRVTHTQEEFVLAFANIIAKEGAVVARVFVSPPLVRRIIDTLSENLKEYEDRYRTKVRRPKEPPPEIGFKS